MSKNCKIYYPYYEFTGEVKNLTVKGNLSRHLESGNNSKATFRYVVEHKIVIVHEIIAKNRLEVKQCGKIIVYDTFTPIRCTKRAERPLYILLDFPPIVFMLAP